jgi:hypothetical protein
MKFFFLLLFPFLVFSQDIDLDNLELGDVDLPSFEEIEILKGPKSKEKFPSTINNFSTRPGGIHESFPIPQYGKEEKGDGEIKWDQKVTPTKNEDYYLNFGIGPGSITYTGNNGSYDSGIALSLDLFGAYWPKYNQNFMYGVLVNLMLDQVTVNEKKHTPFQLTAALSLYYFFGANIGSGFFGRGDLGFGMIPVLTEAEDNNISSSWLWGGKWLIGGGYAFPLWDETRILLGINYGSGYTTYRGLSKNNDSYVLDFSVLF